MQEVVGRGWATQHGSLSRMSNARTSVSTRDQARYVRFDALEIVCLIGGERSCAVLQGPRGRTEIEIVYGYQLY